MTYEDMALPEYCEDGPMSQQQCCDCWNREIPEEEMITYIKEPAREDDVLGPSEDDEPILDKLGREYGKRCADYLKKHPEIVDKINDIGFPYVVSSDTVNEALNKVEDKVFGELGVPPHILDSGNRREFETGAVRDIQEGKGRCDLMPLDVVGELLDKIHAGQGTVLRNIATFQETQDSYWLFNALERFSERNGDKTDSKRYCTMFLECAIHFEEGAKKYGESNWQKGIPTHCYIDSAVRHYLKYLRGDKDEPHDRAFVWNILCCIWTCKHKPELNDYAKERGDK